MRPQSPLYQNQTRIQKKREREKIKANITDEHRYKNPQQNISKPKTKTNIYQKDHTRDALILQCLQINQCDIPHQQTEK